MKLTAIKGTLLLCIMCTYIPNLVAQIVPTHRDSIIKAFGNEKNPVKKETLLKAWESVIPPSEVNGYDWPRLLLAQSFAIAGNFDKAYEYAMKMDTLFFRADGLMGLGQYMLKNGDTVRATKLFQRSLSSAEPFRDADPKTANNNAMFAKESYGFTVSAYFRLLFKQKNYKEAAIYGQLEDKYKEKKDTGFYFAYATTLLNLNRKAESLAPLETYIKNGGTDKNLLDQIKSAYLASGKPEKGYKKYAESLKAEQNQFLKTARDYKVAPDFNLKDMDGKMVSLASLKGKVVVLDFWATWCGPCIKSFPAMQKAVTHYTEDKNVVFLFIDTFEKIPDYEAKTKALISNAKYDFKVLFDPKDKDTGKYLAADGYGVKNIPTKIIIDRKGKIRTTLSGFSGDDKAAVEELVTLIERAKKA